MPLKIQVAHQNPDRKIRTADRTILNCTIKSGPMNDEPVRRTGRPESGGDLWVDKFSISIIDYASVTLNCLLVSMWKWVYSTDFFLLTTNFSFSISLFVQTFSTFFKSRKIFDFPTGLIFRIFTLMKVHKILNDFKCFSGFRLMPEGSLLVIKLKNHQNHDCQTYLLDRES